MQECGTSTLTAYLILTWIRRSLIQIISLTLSLKSKIIVSCIPNNEKVSHFVPISEEEKAQKELLLSIAFKNGRYWVMPVSINLFLLASNLKFEYLEQGFLSFWCAR
jgi:hypothetical protein